MQAICNKLFLFITFDMYFIRTTYSGRKRGESEGERKGEGGGESWGCVTFYGISDLSLIYRSLGLIVHYLKQNTRMFKTWNLEINKYISMSQNNNCFIQFINKTT